MPDWIGYPPAPPTLSSVPRGLYPFAKAGQALGQGLGGFDAALGAVPSYLSEPIPLDGSAAVGGDPGNLGTFMFGTGNLAEPTLQPAPDTPTAPYIDTGMGVVQKLRPDIAAEIFAGGSKLGLPAPIAPMWGGTDFQSTSTFAPGGDPSADGPLLTASQMQQDAKARQQIDQRYPLAGTYDPMGQQIDAAKNLHQLEELLPADQRPTFGKGGAFTQDESGTIRNVPRTPIQGGDTAGLELLRQKLGLETEAEIRQKFGSADQLIDSDLALAMQEIDSLQIPPQQKDLLKQKALAGARAKKLLFREYAIAGRPKFEFDPTTPAQ